MVTKSCTSLLRALLIIARVNLANELYPGVIAAPLILGTIAGCGGRLLADGIKHSWSIMSSYAELTAPGFVSRSGLLAAAVYYFTAFYFQIMPQAAAAGLIVTALMMHTFLADVTGQPLDFTEPLAHSLHIISNVPKPFIHIPGPVHSAVHHGTGADATVRPGKDDNATNHAADAKTTVSSTPVRRSNRLKDKQSGYDS
eukprot:jgi/Chrzof1/4021/Cz13g17150.t1